MSNNSVNFKFGSTIEGKSIEANDLVVINEGIAADGNSKFGAIYKGDKMVGTTKADSLYTTEPITIAGGPLADFFDDVYSGTIPAGTSLQDFISALACVEKWPNPAATASYGTLTSTLSAPSSTQSWSGSNKLVEYGSTISVGEVTAANASANAPALTFSNFAYGFATTTGKHTVSKNTNPSKVNATVTTATTDVEYTLTREYSNNVGRQVDHSSDSVKGANGSGLSFAAEDVTAGLGSNTVKFTLSVNKQIHSATVAAPSVYYALSNLGNTDKDNVSQQKVDKTSTYTYTPSPAIPASASSSTYTVTGVWPVYSNIKSGAFTASADTRCALQTSKVFEFTDTPTEVGSANNFKFDYPATHSISSFEMKDPSGNWVAFSADYNTDSVANMTKTVQGVERSYKRLTTAGGNGPMTYRITLNKTLDQ
jgi:hypothetical protein